MQPVPSKGSQYWLQQCLLNHREHLNRAISETCALTEPLIWASPVPPRFTEFRDAAFLKALDLERLTDKLGQFWPKQDPCWDGLARKGETRILVETKANLTEWISDGKASSLESIEQIRKSLDEASVALKAKPHIDWSRGLFQFANRLAHQWFLQDRCGIDTKLVFLSFTSDSTHLPHSKDEFTGALKMAESLLGLGTGHEGRRYFHVFIDVNDLPAVPSE